MLNIPELGNATIEAKAFAEKIPESVPSPSVSSDGESEIVFRWKGDNRRLVVSFDEDPGFGYAYYQGGQFLPGSEDGISANGLPSDLLEYLADIYDIPDLKAA